MKNTASRANWGLIFVLIGAVLAGRAFGILDFNIFFHGWWTLFIIIPSALGLSDRGNRTSSIIGLGIGILLLLSAQGIFDWGMFAKLIVAFLFVVVGVTLVTKGNREKEYVEDRSYAGNQNNADSDTDSYSKESTYNNTNSDSNNTSSRSTNHGGYNQFSSILSGRNIQFVDELFSGGAVTSILGNTQLDLRNAFFNGNAVIQTTCILGGVDIYVPANVKVVINCTPILAGVDNDVIMPKNTSGEFYTLFINGTCILGGIDVK
jgi:predicted membrane protein